MEYKKRTIQPSQIVTGQILDDALALEDCYPNYELKSTLFSDISDDSADEMLVQASQMAEDRYAEELLLCDGDDEELLQASQNFENAPKSQNSDRFPEPLEYCQLTEMVKKSVPENTRNKSKWAFNVFEQWKKNRNTYGNTENDTIIGDILTMSNQQLDMVLSFFIAEVRNKQGKEYCPKTIYELVIALQHYLRSNDRQINLLESSDFVKMRSVLDSRMKDLSMQGLGLNKKQALIINAEQEDTLWEQGLLGNLDTPQKLLDTMVFYMGLNFALRAGKEHWNLRIGSSTQIKLHSTPTGRRYLEYTEDVSKTNAGGLYQKNVSPKVTRAYENDNQPERCLLNLYLDYMSKRPENGKCDAFYLRPSKSGNGAVRGKWFDDAPVGIHTLQRTIGRLCNDAGFDGFYTNHSLRATAATRLFSAGVDEQLICEKTGHRSDAIRGYKRTSEQQQELVSKIVQSAKCQKVDNSLKNDKSCEFSFEGNGMKFNFKF
ncbi:zinc finger MYM-type protein 2-like [Ruditapes philippinarum]|uniref:zinc finger MYM-type protein 2-like n=1 Tax=Ruditapes philippinarum TaxID=129788 RepID=UPI00295B6090|nr:zinc finger MYM-type protein 2-like [Ruditapes philippinarum]